MKLIVVKCPECQAKVKVAPEAQHATCEYCGAEAQVQRRTGVLRRPVPLPPHTEQAPQLPIALEQAGKPWWAWLLLAVIPLAVAAPCVGGAILCNVKQAGEALLRAQRAAPQWEGGGVLTVDLNGDGVWDIVGHMYRNTSGSKQRSLLAAIDGANGKMLWPPLDLGERAHLKRTPQGAVGSTFLLADGGAQLRAIALKTGQIRWQALLPEKITSVCKGESSASVGVETADKMTHRVTLAAGAIEAASKAQRGACVALPGGDPSLTRADRRVCTWYGGCFPQTLRHGLDGLSATTALYRPSAKRAIALARKEPGTRVPTLVAYVWPAPGPALKLEWKAPLPRGNPLGVNTQDLEPRHVDLDGELVVATYQQRSENDAVHLTAFALASGQRRWDVVLPGRQSVDAVALTPTHVVVSAWHALYTVERKSGALAHAIVFGQ